MKALYVRCFQAAATLLLIAAMATSARATKPAPAYVDVIITYAGESFGFSGPLRYFDLSDAGGRIGFDVTILETRAFSPRPNIDVADLRMPGNHWQLVLFGGRTPETIAGTCAVESFVTTENDVRLQHVFLNCVDLDP